MERSDTSDVSTVSDDRSDSTEVSDTLQTLCFDIELNSNEWNEIKPAEKLYGDDRVYETLQKGWTDIVALKLWKSTKLQCAYKFKKHHVYKSENYPYFTFYGSCTEPTCRSTLSGRCLERPSDNNPTVKIHIETQDTSKIRHNKKRRFGSRRRIIGKNSLKYIRAKHFKVKEVQKLMDESDPLPALLSSSGVYQKARQEALDEEIGLENFPGTVIESLHAIMHFTTNIQFLSTSPFQVMFRRNSQKKLLEEALQLDEAILSIDASGSFVKAIKLSDNSESPAIFLYVKVIRFGGKIYPVSQMLSAAHDTNSICDWLLLDMEDDKSIPKTIVVDCSLALLNAISLAYNECSYNNYLSICFKILINDDDCTYTLPNCLIKRDRAHLIKNVATWKCFDGKDWRVKDFYTRCIAYSLNIADFQLLKDVISAMCIICQSTHCDSTSESFKRKIWLMEKIKTFNYHEFTESELKEKNNFSSTHLIEIEKDVESSNDITTYLYQLLNSCNLKCAYNNDDFLKPNYLECPDLVDSLITLYSQFPSWTNCMNRFYATSKDVSTSSGSECFFRILRREFEMNHPITANRFVLKYLSFIEGEIKFGRGLIKNCNNETKNENKSKSLTTKSEHQKIKIKTTSDNSIKNPSGKDELLSVMNLQNLNISSTLPIIQNGIFIDSENINGRMLKFLNICAFDSIAEIVSDAYCHLQMFRENVNEYLCNNNNNFLNAIKKFAMNHSLDEFYKRRAEILLPIVCPNSVPNDQCTLDCVMNVTSLFDKVTKSFSDRLGYFSCTNNKCLWKTTFHYQSKIIDSFTENDLVTFDDLINSWFKEATYTCRKCKTPNGILNQTVGCYVAFDVEHFYVNIYESNLVNNCTRNVNNLPITITIDNKEYTLTGVVGFRPNHYFACLRKHNFWEVRDDMKNSVKHIPIGSLNIYIALIIYIKVI